MTSKQLKGELVSENFKGLIVKLSESDAEIDAKFAFDSTLKMLEKIKTDYATRARIEILIDRTWRLCGDDNVARFRLFSCSMEYQDYLTTKHWTALKKVIKEQYSNACSLCTSSENLHVHHRSYERIGREFWGDVILLCAKCHELFHKNCKAGLQFTQKLSDEIPAVTKKKERFTKEREHDIQPTTRQARNAQAAANQKRGLHSGMDDNHR